SDCFYFVCHESHPLASHRRLTASEIQQDFPIIAYRSASSIRQHLDAVIYPRQWKISYEVHNLSTAAGLVMEGVGATITPTLGLRQFRDPLLRIIPVDLPIDERKICLLRLKDRKPSLAADAFMRLIKTHFSTELDRLRPE